MAQHVADSGPVWKSDSLYFDSLASNRSLKADLLLGQLDSRYLTSSRRGCVIVDIGCAAGDVLAEVHDRLPDADLVGVDIEDTAIEDALAKVPGATFVQADVRVDRLPIDDGSADIVYVSSVLHELIGEDAMIKEGLLTDVFRQMRRILKPLGRLVIREPAIPPDPDRIIVLALPRTLPIGTVLDGVAPAFASLTEAGLFEKFVGECSYLGNAPIRRIDSPDPVREAWHSVPAWVAGEYLRKRTFVDHVGNWESEMRERNAALTVTELRTVLERAGFDPAAAVVRFVMEEGFYGELTTRDGVTLRDCDGGRLDQAAVLPSHFHAVVTA